MLITLAPSVERWYKLLQECSWDNAKKPGYPMIVQVMYLSHRKTETFYWLLPLSVAILGGICQLYMKGLLTSRLSMKWDLLGQRFFFDKSMIKDLIIQIDCLYNPFTQ